MERTTLSAIGSARQGYTPVRGPISLSVKVSGLLLWTRHALVSTGGMLKFELVDSILQLRPGELDNLVIDPLSDTRILKGDSGTPGAILSRYMANDGNGQECKYVQMANPNIVEGRGPSEFLRLDNLLLDGATAGMAPTHVDIARTSTPAVTPIPAFSAVKDGLLVFVVNFNDLNDDDFCPRFQLTTYKGTDVVWDMRLPLPRLLIKTVDTLRQQLVLGMEVKSGVDGFLAIEETSGISPAMCFNVYFAPLQNICSYRVDQRAPSMKFLKYEDMLNNPTRSTAPDRKPGFDPHMSSLNEGSDVRDDEPRRKRRT
jgi:hypothetical protein